MALCLSCRGLKTLPGMGMMGTRKCDECKGTGKGLEEVKLPTRAKIIGQAVNAANPDDDVFIVEASDPRTVLVGSDKAEIYHPAQTMPVEDVEIKRTEDKKKAAKSKSKFKWKD